MERPRWQVIEEDQDHVALINEYWGWMDGELSEISVEAMTLGREWNASVNAACVEEARTNDPA